MTDIVKISDAGHVRTIALNRPEKKNALSDALAWGVIAAVEDAARTDDVWVVALTGSGDPKTVRQTCRRRHQWGGRGGRPWSRHGDRRAPDQPQRKAHGRLYENRRFTRRRPHHHPSASYGL